MSARLALVSLVLLGLHCPAHAESILVRSPGVSAQAEGSRMVRRFSFIDVEEWDTQGEPAWEVIHRLAERGIYAEPDQQFSIAATPNDSLYPIQWNLDNSGQTGGTLDADVDAPEAWELYTGSGDVVVAILDTGIDYNHPDLAAHMWTNPGEIPGNGIDDERNGYIDDVHGYDAYNDDGDPLDDHGHGTHVAGIVGAVTNNGSGTAGVNWNVKLMAVKMLHSGGNGTTGSATNGLEYVHTMQQRMGVRIINNSWGSAQPGPFTLEAAINACTALGILVVCAAGNNNFNLDCCAQIEGCNTGFYPACFVDPGIVSVGMSDHNDLRDQLSNYGATKVDLFAPGTAVWSTWNVAPFWRTLTGTSMASPHVAGAAALLWGLQPSMSAASIKAGILATVDQRPAFNGLCVTGGRLNLHSLLIGTTSVEPSRLEPVLEGTYDIQGRKAGPIRSGVTFQRKGKRVTVR